MNLLDSPVGLFTLISLIIFLIYEGIEKVCYPVKDEREELIRLKTLDIVQKINVITLSILSILFVINFDLTVDIVIATIILSSFYCEIFAKLFFRKKY